MSPAAAVPSPSLNPFEIARAHLIRRLVEIDVPKPFPVRAHSSCFTTVGEHIRDMAIIFDEWLALVGEEIADNSHNPVDMRLFREAFLGAVDGQAIYETQCAGLVRDREVA